MVSTFLEVNSYMFLGVALQRGEFDDQLRWPFKGEVKVQVYNHTAEKWSNEKGIRLSKEACGMECVERCVDVQSTIIQTLPGTSRLFTTFRVKALYCEGQWNYQI